jgi:putative ABC transport system ATP-binding protein
MSVVIEAQGLTKIYRMGESVIRALQGIDLAVEEGQFVAVMGASGSGKSTLLNLLGCLDRATSGKYFLAGRDVSALGERAYASIRNKQVGFVFQGFNLLPRMSALENVELPLLYARGNRPGDPRGAAVEALERVGLGARLRHEPNQLSGGEQQRVAIARALVNRPSLILADEPTGNLDSRTSVDILDLFQKVNEAGITLVLVTHNAELAKCAERIVYMRDGLISNDVRVSNRYRGPEELSRVLGTSYRPDSSSSATPPLKS